jgi:uncharacterized damage-inducible protein DinB
MARPSLSDASFGQHYIALAQGNSAKEVVANHAAEILEFYTSLPEQKKDFAYAEGKWTIIEVLQHVIDAERVFTYRALRFARKDATPLPGFDENDYAANSNAAARDFDALKQEFIALRKATDIFISSLDEEQLQQGGTSNNKYITVNALAFIIYGHLLHHINITKERYLAV